jgi:hypothetical protein
MNYDLLPGWMRHFSAWLELSEKARGLNALLQLVAAASATLYVIYPKYNDRFASIFIVSMTLSLAISLIVFLFYRRTGLNVLRFQRSTGILFDEKTGIPNVALRRETMQNIVKHCEEHGSREKLEALGLVIGKNFIECYREKNLLGKTTSSGEEVLRKVCEYDSSSGMGKFEVVRFSQGRRREIEIAVWNPFVESDGDELSPFLQGYLLGVCSEILGGHFTPITHRKRTEGINHIVELTMRESPAVPPV